MAALLRTVLFEWQGDLIALIGIAVEVSFVLAYVIAAALVRRTGGRWPTWRTACFTGGLFVLALSLQSGLARYDETLWAHVLQHQLLMCVAPALIALGGPAVLALRTMPAIAGRRVVGVLHCRALNWMNKPSAALVLPLHYYGMMYAFLLTPAYALSQQNAVFHEAAHAYFLACGTMFWVPVLGQLPSRWHPSYRTKFFMVLSGLPATLALATALSLLAPLSGTSGLQETRAGAAVLAVAGVVTSAFGLFLVAATSRRRPVALPMVFRRTVLAASRHA